MPNCLLDNDTEVIIFRSSIKPNRVRAMDVSMKHVMWSGVRPAADGDPVGDAQLRVAGVARAAVSMRDARGRAACAAAGVRTDRASTFPVSRSGVHLAGTRDRARQLPRTFLCCELTALTE